MNSMIPARAVLFVSTMCVLLLAVSLSACSTRRRGGSGPAPADGGSLDAAARVDGSLDAAARVDADSGQICMLGETRCRDMYNVEACAPSSDFITLTWVNATTCYGGQVCVAGACVAGVDGGGAGCQSVSAVEACNMQAGAMCDRMVACCVGGATWCQPYLSFLSTRSTCLTVLESYNPAPCSMRTSQPPVCSSDVAICTSAYAAPTCDAIGTAVVSSDPTSLNLPTGCS